MPFNILLTVIAAMCLILSQDSYAFDPFTVAAVVSVASQAVSKISDAAGDVASTADSFSELYNEIDSGAELSSDGARLTSQIHEIESMAYEAGYTKDEIGQLQIDASDPSRAKTLSLTLQTMTKAIRAGKQAARLLLRLDKRAQLSQVESTQIQREELIVLYKTLEEAHERDLNQLRDKLKDQLDKRNQIATLKSEEKQISLEFGSTGVLSFPKQESIVEGAIQIAVSMRPALFGLILFVFLVRVIGYQFSLSSHAQFGSLIKETIVCAVLLLVFPDLIRAMVALCNDLSAYIGMKDLKEIEPKKLDFPANIGFTVLTRLNLELIFQWIKFIALIVAKFIANFGLGFLILLFPLIVFSSQMLNFSIAWPLFLGGFISICLWPFFWNATGALALMLWKSPASFSDHVATILFSVLQFLSPLIGIECLKGQPLSKAIAGSAVKVMGGTEQIRNLVGKTSGDLKQGVTGSKGENSSKPVTLGRVLSYPINQVAGRAMAMGTSAIEAKKSKDASVKSVLKAAATGLVMNKHISPDSKKQTPGRNIVNISNGLKRRDLLVKRPTIKE